MNILLVDERTLSRHALMNLLKDHLTGVNVFEAKSAEQAIEICKSKSIDIVLTELALPIDDGTELAYHFQKWKDRKFKVVVVSGYTDVIIVNQLLESGVDGYIPKTCTTKTLINGLHEVMNNNIYFPEEFDEKIKKLIHFGKVALFKISASERKIIKYLSLGKTNKEIASLLGYGTRTIETKRYRLERKFRAKGAAHMISIAYRTGILQITDPI